MDNPVGMPQNSMKAQDGQPERREDSKHRVVLGRQYSNSSSSPLQRAIRAYRRLKVMPPRMQIPPPPPVRRVIQLNDRQIARIVERYEAGTTTYELATEFNVHRATISQHIKTAGVKMRLQPLTPQQVDAAVALYATGLSLADVGRELGCHASTVLMACREKGVEVRKPWDHPRQRRPMQDPPHREPMHEPSANDI